MNVIQEYLDSQNITRYEVSKKSGIAATTLQSAVDRENATDGLTGKVIKAIAKALDKTPGTVLDEILKIENNKHWI